MAEFELEREEHVMAAVRKHPLIAVGKLIPFVILAYLPTLLPEFSALIQTVIPAESLSNFLSTDNPWTRFVIGMYWLFVWMGAFGAFTDYYLDQFIITNHRIIRIDQAGFFDRQVSSLHLNRVQDVLTDIEGVFAELFGYGTLSVETAGEDPTRFRISGVAHVRHLRDLIMKEVTERQENITRISSSGLN